MLGKKSGQCEEKLDGFFGLAGTPRKASGRRSALSLPQKIFMEASNFLGRGWVVFPARFRHANGL